MITLRFP